MTKDSSRVSDAQPARPPSKVARTLWKLTGFLAAITLSLATITLFYGVFGPGGGIPYQDPTPAQIKMQVTNAKVTSVLGIVTKIAIWLTSVAFVSAGAWTIVTRVRRLSTLLLLVTGLAALFAAIAWLRQIDGALRDASVFVLFLTVPVLLYVVAWFVFDVLLGGISRLTSHNRRKTHE